MRTVYVVRYALTRCFYMFMGLRVAHWRKAVEEIWNKASQDVERAAHLERNRPKDADGNSITTLVELHSAPSLTKSRLRELGKQKTPRGFHRHTAGSSGQLTNVWLTRNDLGRMLGVRDYCYRACGIRLGYREGRLWGRSEITWKTNFKDFLLNRKIFYPAGDSVATETERLIRWRPQYIYGYASLLMTCARQVKDEGWELPELQCVIVTAETILPTQKNYLSSVFGCPVHEEYGASEFDIIAFECRLGHRHLVNPWLVVEGDAEGQAIVTDVTRTNQPMVRYAIGDVLQLCTCSCKILGDDRVLLTLKGRTIDQFAFVDSCKRFHAVEFGYAVNRYQKEENDHFRFSVTQSDYARFIVQCDPEPIKGTSFLCSYIASEIKKSTGYIIKVEACQKVTWSKCKNSYFLQKIDNQLH